MEDENYKGEDFTKFWYEGLPNYTYYSPCVCNKWYECPYLTGDWTPFEDEE